MNSFMTSYYDKAVVYYVHVMKWMNILRIWGNPPSFTYHCVHIFRLHEYQNQLHSQNMGMSI